MAAFSTLCAAHTSYQNNPDDRKLQKSSEQNSGEQNVENKNNVVDEDDEDDEIEEGFDGEGGCDTEFGFEVVVDEQNGAQNDEIDASVEVPQSFLLTNANLTAKQKKRVDKIRSKQVSKGENYASSGSQNNVASAQNDIKIEINKAPTPCSNTPAQGMKFDWHAAKAAAQRACQPKSNLTVPSASSSTQNATSNQKYGAKKRNASTSHGNRSNFGGSEVGEPMRQFYENIGIDPDSGEAQLKNNLANCQNRFFSQFYFTKSLGT